MMLTQKESDAHFTRRLESFSDVVFGLSLSITALQLVLPKEHPREIFSNPIGLIGFAIAFGLISMFWGYQHNIFTYYFFPDRLNIVLAFVKLALIALFPYLLLIWLKFASDPLANTLYASASGLIAAANAITIFRGVRVRWDQFDDAFRRHAWGRFLQVVVIAMLFLCAAVVSIVDLRFLFIPYLLIPLFSVIAKRFARHMPDFGSHEALADA